MVAAQQHLGNALPLPLFWTCVVRVIQQAIQRGVEAVLDMAGLVLQHTRLQAHHGIQQGHGGNLAA